MSIRNTRITTMLVLAVGLLTMCGSANATIVNLDATCENGCGTNIVSLDHHTAETSILAAGTYNVDMVGIAGGGLFDAWSAWGNSVSPRWITKYYIQAPSNTGWIAVGSTAPASRWLTPVLALDNALSYSFTLAVAGTVKFSIQDGGFGTTQEGGYGDNAGGLSLSVTSATPSQVPEPTTLALLALGLVGISAWRRQIH